ncbi:MAG: arginine--tRNA ligase [Planctomycetota bacterium]
MAKKEDLMNSAIDILEERISAAMKAVTGRADCAAIVRPATDARFGDYQANGVMALAKQLKTNPRKLAEEVVKNFDLSDICQPPEVAGPGFINLRLNRQFLEKIIIDFYSHRIPQTMPDGGPFPYPQERFGIDKVSNPKTIVVDFSSPNIAKQMHVGHLRSTIIGDCICNILRFLGHNVIPQNHIGDWGTQFGMLCALYNRERDKTIKKGDEDTFPYLPLKDLEAFYKEANILFDTDEKFAQESREALVGLQSGDQIWIGLWRQIVRQSQEHFNKIYEKLNVLSAANNIRGESFYKDMLSDVVHDLMKNQELKGKGLVGISDGAVCVFPPGFKNKEGKDLGFIIQKSDGAYLYATTDLAALRYRVTGIEYEGKIYKADKIIYVTDSRQKLHFEMLFAVAKMAGWDIRQNTEDRTQKTEFVHVTFGSVLGEDGAPLKTRSGENVKLKELLDEAIERAMSVVEEKNPELPENKKAEIAKAVGIGAVKYADYSNNRTSDYVFSFDKMLAMDGNTAPYMQYAYARICSIMDKGKKRGIDTNKEISNLTILNLTEPAEIDLAKCLVRYGESIQAATADYRPNYLTAYLYDLSQKFSAFYTNCPVLIAGPDKKPTRLLLCDLTARTIRHGLHELLGIEVVEQM